MKFIEDNYLQFSRLRHDVISDKLQVRVAHRLSAPHNATSVIGDPAEDAALSGYSLEFKGGEYWREMTKHDINSIGCHCAQACNANITSREVMTALQSDLIPDVHPLREYILSLPPFTPDQPDWIDFVAKQVHVRESALWRTCFKKWFVAMVASWMRDDIVNHQVLVLIGKQGIYKTTWLEHLIPPHLRAYACKLANSNDLNKDERLRIAEFGLISLDEIDSMNSRELNQLKSIITATDVNERAAYAYTKERRVRLASFCASGNRRDFLTDITGNRRWLPFEVESIQSPFTTILPYERMYAQAWALAQDPFFSYWFDLDEIEVLEQHNQHFRDESNEEQLLPILFDVPAEGKGEFLTTAQISERLITYGNIKKPMALSRLGMLLGAHGFQKKTIGVQRLRGWLVYQRSMDEINANKRLYAK